MASLSNRPTHLLMREILFEGLRLKDERLNALATELCGRFEEEAVRRLVLDTENRKNRPAHRARALQAIARIGAVSDPSSFEVIFALTMDRSAEVRDAAARTGAWIRRLESAPAGLPPT